MKPIVFLGDSRENLLTFPEAVRSRVGHDLYMVQEGAEPQDFKPMPVIGAGVYEIRVRAPSGAYRVIYIAKLKQAVYVLHAFQKKTQKTAATDIALATKRLAGLKDSQ